MNKPILGIQGFTLRDFCQNTEDFDNILGFLQELGVKTIQISAIGPIPADEQKKALDKHSIDVCVTHKPFDRMLNDLDNLIEEHKIINCDAIGLGAPSEEYRGSLQNVKDFVDKANAVAKKLKEHGMTFNYHNHDFEFKTMENGQTMMDYIIENTDPDCFHFIPDVAWIHFAGENPVEYLDKMKGRIKVVHFKDYCPVNGERKFCTLGEGLVDLKACYNKVKELNIPYIMYEQDCDWVDNDVKKATKLSWEYMNSIAD